MEYIVEHRVEEWLFPETITRGEQLLLASVVDREREHSFDALNARRTELLVGMQYDFRVRDRSETVPFRLEQRPQRTMVVDFAVENDPARLVFVGHRLMASSAIDNRQPPVSE